MKRVKTSLTSLPWISTKMNVALLLDKLDTHGSEDFKIDKENEFNNQWGALLKAREEYYKNASKVLLKDL